MHGVIVRAEYQCSVACLRLRDVVCCTSAETGSPPELPQPQHSTRRLFLANLRQSPKCRSCFHRLASSLQHPCHPSHGDKIDIPPDLYAPYPFTMARRTNCGGVTYLALCPDAFHCLEPGQGRNGNNSKYSNLQCGYGQAVRCTVQLCSRARLSRPLTTLQLLLGFCTALDAALSQNPPHAISSELRSGAHASYNTRVLVLHEAYTWTIRSQA